MKRIALAAVLVATAAQATVTGNPPPSIYSCNGTTTTYTISFPYLAVADLSVTKTTAGVVSTLSLGTDYSASPSQAPSVGTLRLTSGGVCPNGSTLTISRNMPLTQPTSFRTGAYNGPATEQSFDRAGMQIQQNAATHAADKAAQTARDTAQDTAIAAAINPTPVTVNSNSLVLATGSATSRTLAARAADVVNVKDDGATGDGSTDDTTAIRAALTRGAGKTIYFPRPAVSYKVTDTLSVTVANTRLRGDGSMIFMALPSNHASGRLFDVTASGVEFDNLWIDSTGTPTTTSVQNKYGIYAHGTSGTHITNIRVRNCKFTHLPWMDAAAVLASHAVLVQFADNVVVRNNTMDAVSGAAVILSVVTNAEVQDNFINDTGWYSIQLNDQVNGGRISGNRITGTLPNDRVWGGSINLMSNSQTGGACGTNGCATIKNIEIDHNYISGVHSYTAAVSIQSASRISFHDNRIENISLTQGMTLYPGAPFYADGTPPDYIRVFTRTVGAPIDEGACDHISIERNTMIANGVSDLGIYADNAHTAGSGYADTLSIKNNVFISPDASNNFSHAIAVHGQNGGWKNVSIIGNQASGIPVDANPVAGLIGTISNVAVPILDTQINDNEIRFIGTASTTNHEGIGVGQYTQRVSVRGNHVGAFYQGIRTFANASEIALGPNVFDGSVDLDYVLGAAPTVAIGTVPRYGTGIFITGRGANLGVTNVVAAAAAGEYRVCVSARTTTSGTGTTATLNIIWTDDGGVKTDAVGTWALNSLTVTGQINKCEYVHSAASTDIQVSVTGGTYGTSLYAISATAEKLN